MSKVVATTVLPEDSGEVLTFGDTGDAIAISGDSLNMNNLQDAGGNNIFTSNGSGTITSTVLGGSYKLLTTNTFTGTTSSTFTSLIDSTYDVYCFRYNAINPATQSNTKFEFQCSTDGGNSYSTTMTTTFFRSNHTEDNTTASLSYSTGMDQAQGTAYQALAQDMSNDADACGVGELYLFSPSSTTYAKQFYAKTQFYYESPGAYCHFAAGYFNTTSAINAISFKMSTGNMDGQIKMYGISKS